MRIGIACVLAVSLFGSTSAYAQVWDGDRSLAPYNGPASAANNSAAGSAPALLDHPAGIGNEDDERPDNYAPRLAWLRSDYLIWFVRKQTVPPLIGTVPDSVANNSNLPAGAITTLFPTNGNSNNNAFNGVRVNAGFWFDGGQNLGLDATGFYLEQRSNGAAFASQGSPVLALLYRNANSGQITELQLSNPDPNTGYGGMISARTTISSLYGTDLNVRMNGYRVFSDSTDYLFGGRYFDFRERIDINGAANFRDGSSLRIHDHFAVSNQFYGGQAGIHARWANWYGFSVDSIFKLALGGVAQRAIINGDNTQTTAAGVANTQPSGLLAQPSNSGVHEKGKFAVLPELTLNLNYNITQSAAVFVGYNVLYVSNVLRAGRTIDPNVNDSSLRYLANPTPGNAPNPVFAFRDQGLWVQGINLGLRLEY